MSLPQRRAVILAQAVTLLAAEIGSIAAARILYDVREFVVITELEPSAPYLAFLTLPKLSITHERVTNDLVVDLCSTLERKIGAQAGLEPKELQRSRSSESMESMIREQERIVDERTNAKKHSGDAEDAAQTA